MKKILVFNLNLGCDVCKKGNELISSIGFDTTSRKLSLNEVILNAFHFMFTHSGSSYWDINKKFVDQKFEFSVSSSFPF